MKVLVYPALEEWGDVADEFHGFELQPEFDALEALRTEGLLPPNPRVRPLDNLHKCRRILPTVSLSQFFIFYFSLDCSYLHCQVQLNILQILLHLWPLQRKSEVGSWTCPHFLTKYINLYTYRSHPRILY